ncbi:hypothetical protein CHN51_08235 [Sphingorhabdus sp. YGSMI21]|nr:hypothetical protein CHN51_08235 [Sphingorhabdus sp. YGSMI21]
MAECWPMQWLLGYYATNRCDWMSRANIAPFSRHRIGAVMASDRCRNYSLRATGLGIAYLNIRVLRVISISLSIVKSRSRLKLTPVTKGHRKAFKTSYD